MYLTPKECNIYNLGQSPGKKKRSFFQSTTKHTH